MQPISNTQRRVLETMAARPDGLLNHDLRARLDVHAGTIRALLRRGYIDHVFAPLGHRSWTITHAGLAVLKETP